MSNDKYEMSELLVSVYTNKTYKQSHITNNLTFLLALTQTSHIL